jgi:hypothetical protein
VLTSANVSPVTRLRPTPGVDSVGDRVLSWASPTRSPIPHASVTSLTSAADGSRITGRGLLVIVGEFDLAATDRVEHEGRVWRIDGDPLIRRSLASGVLVEANLARVEVHP